MRITVIGLTAAMLAGCSDQSSADDPAWNASAAAPPKAPHCFFKDSETKDWAVKVADGAAVVTGRGFRSDARYKAVLLEPSVNGRTAEVRPSISINDTGYAADGNWWDLQASVPAAGIDTIEVRCGSKLVASLAVPKPAG